MNKYVAEGFGTFVLVLVGCGAAVIAGDALGLLGVALAFGLAVMTMVYTIGNISGCHINPAITFAMMLRGDMSLKEALCYMGSQVIGALIAAAVLTQLAANPGILAANTIGTGYDQIAVLLGEVLFTALFILVIFWATAKKGVGDLAGVVIGLALTMSIMVMGPVSNASFNPARSIGPAALAGGDAMAQLWMFILAPMVWAALAVIVWRHVLCQK